MELQKTRAESCSEEISETLDNRGEPAWCGLLDPIPGGSMASEILTREEVFRDQEDQVRVNKDPCEAAKKDPYQHCKAAEEKISPSQGSS